MLPALTFNYEAPKTPVAPSAEEANDSTASVTFSPATGYEGDEITATVTLTGSKATKSGQHSIQLTNSNFDFNEGSTAAQTFEVTKDASVNKTFTFKFDMPADAGKIATDDWTLTNSFVERVPLAFAASGNTATINNVTATADFYTNSDETYTTPITSALVGDTVKVVAKLAGEAEKNGQHTLGFTGSDAVPAASAGATFDTTKGNAPSATKVFTFVVADAVADLVLTNTFNETKYAFNTPDPVSGVNGLSTAVTFDKTSPVVAGTVVTATVTITGTAAKTGVYSVNLKSIKTPALDGTAQSFENTVADTAYAGGTAIVKTFTFTMPAATVDDLAVDFDFVEDSAALELAEPGDVTFFDAKAGASATTSQKQAIIIKNTGNLPTGLLKAVKTDASSAFEIGLSADGTGKGNGIAEIPSIAAGGEATIYVFTVASKTADNYSGDVTISAKDGNITTFTQDKGSVKSNLNYAVLAADKFDIGFAFSAGTSGATYTTPEAYAVTYPTVEVGYAQPKEITITVVNDGTTATGALDIDLTGDGKDNFTVAPAGKKITTVAWNDSEAFTLAPKANLPIGTYTVTVALKPSVGNVNEFVKDTYTFGTVTFTVKAVTPGIAGNVVSTGSTGTTAGTVADTTSTTDYTVTASKLNLRAAAVNGKVVAQAVRGSSLKVISIENGWAKIDYNGQTLYASMSYLVKAGTTTGDGAVIARVLNVRAGASTDTRILGKLNRGTTVKILSSANGWGEISMNGVKAYVSLAYIQFK